MNNETISQPQSLSQQGTNITNTTLDASGAGGISGTRIIFAISWCHVMAIIGSLHSKLLYASLKLIFDFGWDVRDDPFLESYSGSFNKMKVGAKTKSTLDIM